MVMKMGRETSIRIDADPGTARRTGTCKHGKGSTVEKGFGGRRGRNRSKECGPLGPNYRSNHCTSCFFKNGEINMEWKVFGRGTHA